MRCPYCQTENQAWAAFCLGCGAALDGAAAPAVAAALGAGAPAAPVPTARRRLDRAPGGRVRRWERLLGLGLALILLAAGAGDLLAQQGRIDQYRAGRAAEIAQHWDAAARAYAAASGYRDAADRARAATGNVRERDRLYQVGQAAAGRGDWPAALSAFTAATAIQADYADLPTRLGAARIAATQLAAAGLVFRQRTGPGAGLYLQGPLDRPSIRLDASDGLSWVAAFAPDGTRLVYDGPGAGRRLYLAVLDAAGGRVGPVRALPADLPTAGWGLFCPGGLWWFNTTTTAVRYYDMQTGAITPIPLGPARVLLSQDPTRGRLLLAESADGLRTRIVLTRADGSDPQVLAVSVGTVRNAEISPDGRWMIFIREEAGALGDYNRGRFDRAGVGTGWEPPRAAATTISLLLVPLDPTAGPPGERLLDHLVLPDEAPHGNGNIRAHFVAGRPALVVANHAAGARRAVSVYEPDDRRETTFRPDAPPDPALAGPYFSPGGSFVLVEEGVLEGIRFLIHPLGTTLPIQRQVSVLARPGSLVLGQITLREDYLLYLVTRQERRLTREQYSLYSVPLVPTVRNGAILLFQDFYNGASINPANITLAPGGTLLAYIRPDGALLAVPFQGGPALHLATGVDEVWSPRP